MTAQCYEPVSFGPGPAANGKKTMDCCLWGERQQLSSVRRKTLCLRLSLTDVPATT